MKPIKTFSVIPSLPEELQPLWDLAYNLRWAWNHDTIELFMRLDSDLWEATGHNPVLMLGTIDQGRLEKLRHDESFRAYLDRVYRHFRGYIEEQGAVWFTHEHGQADTPLFAYFSAEFGLTECLSIFAGGLGVLSGDHLKSASDLGLPLVGVGLLYQQGYFQQYLNQAGWQQEHYEENDFDNLPLHLECDDEGKPLMVRVAFPGRMVTAQIWRAQVGRVSLYMLDTNIDQNRGADRDITDQLYGGDQEMRIQQEILLGIGGYRALQALGLEPTIYHVNEGHSAFLALEHARHLMHNYGLTFAEAREAASAGIVFTTHTPVPAGHDRFPPHLMDHYFSAYANELGLSHHEFLALGREYPDRGHEPFVMTVLAMKMSSYSNGVSKLHGEITRDMWEGLWPGVPQEEIPITHITNGVHFLSWISRDMKRLYDRYLGPRWRQEPAEQEIWQRAKHIAPEELWRTHERRRERLVAFARRRLRRQLQRRGASQSEIEAADEVLDPKALTIGFARRFATYKRATLLLRDPERLVRIINESEGQVQIIYAGMAHPKDNPGKQLIQQIVHLARTEDFRYSLVFLEDYDMTVARYMLQGVDVWLNTPRRPREASGTSGMKAAANGVLNLSVLDGWWDEAYRPGVGWAIGRGEVYDDREYQDYVEAQALYDLLERDVVPTFYDRGRDGLPRKWIEYMKNGMEYLCHFFNTNRMVAEYTERFYMPAATRYDKLTADEMAGAKALAAWKEKIRAGWSEVQVNEIEVDLPAEPQVGDDIAARAWVNLGPLDPEDVGVELYMGQVNAEGEIEDGDAVPMQFVEQIAGQGSQFAVSAVPCLRSGRYGYTVRILPQHADLVTPFMPGYIVWAK